jgi:transcriptional regulator with XRE-family HTH domain
MTSISIIPIPKRELLAYQADVKGSIFRQIRERFSHLKEGGFTQKEFAARIGMNEGQLSRRLRGDFDLRLETLSDLARGLDCRIDVELAPLLDVHVNSTNESVYSLDERRLLDQKWEYKDRHMRGKVHDWRSVERVAMSYGTKKMGIYKDRRATAGRRPNKRIMQHVRAFGDAKRYDKGGGQR